METLLLINIKIMNLKENKRQNIKSKLPGFFMVMVMVIIKQVESKQVF